MLDQKIKETQLQTRRDIDESNKSSISKHIPLMKNIIFDEGTISLSSKDDSKPRTRLESRLKIKDMEILKQAFNVGVVLLMCFLISLQKVELSFYMETIQT